MSKLSLEQQRKRAKDLIKAQRAGERTAAERIAREHPRARRMAIDAVATHAWQLADAQLVIAREAGFPSWPRLVAWVEARARGGGGGVPLHDAVRAGDLVAVQAVLAGAYDPWQTREAIEEAIVRDARPIVRELLAHRGWVDVAGRAHGRWGGGIHAALLLGRDLAMIDELIAGGASIAARDRDGRTPLAIAMRVHRPDAIEALVRAGASDAEADAMDRALGACVAGEQPARLAAPLHHTDHQHLAWALRSGHADALPGLLGLGLDPRVADDDGETPLHLAGSLAAVELLLGAGARVDARNFRGETPIELARRRGDAAIVARLQRAGAVLDDGPDLDDLFEDAVEAIIAGRLDELRGLLDHAPKLVHARSLREHRATLLHYCGANGVEDDRQRTPRNAPAIASLLLARGAEPDALALTYGGGTAQTTLYLAATSSHPEDAGVMRPLLEALLAGGAHVNNDDRDALHYSQRSALPVLVAGGATMDLWLACALGRLDDVRRFVRADGSLAPGAKVGSEATTPDADILDRALHQASASGHRAIVEVLLDAGGRPDAPDVEGFTALHRAVWNDHVDVTRVLLARGAAVNAKNGYGGTVLGTLRWAIENHPIPRPHAEEITAMLLAAGAT